MKNIVIITIAASMMFSACGDTQRSLHSRAEELCGYLPVPGELGQSENMLTEGFYTAVDEIFSLPDFTPVLHQWEFWFTSADGSPIADNACEVLGVEKTDGTHAQASVRIHPADSGYEPENHVLYMEKVDGQWLMSDFDDIRESCSGYIANYRREEAVRNAIGDYLVKEIGVHYAQGDICIPVISVVAEEESETGSRIWGDFQIGWYRLEGETLESVSGGSHSGCMTLQKQGDGIAVTSFDQTADGAGNERSAKRIFGKYFDIYQNIHSNHELREEVRKEAIRSYCSKNGIDAKSYKDYGWPAVLL